MSFPPPSETPTPAQTPPSRPESTKTRTTVYALQIRAFLNASDIVDIDEETVEDILDGFGESAIDAQARVEEEGSDDDGDYDPDAADDSDVELDISGLDEYEEEAAQAWTKQEIRYMKHHLKERGMNSWIKEYVITRNIPIEKLLYAFGICLCTELRKKRAKTLLYFLKVALSRELSLQEKLPLHNTIADAVALIRGAQHILILTGAGISVSCGIPDFRSRDGLYATLRDRGEYDLDDPQQMFDIQYFRENPSVFYSFASQIYPSNFTPSACHRFIKLVEDKNKLLRNYTQNIDTLETRAGVQRVLQCHGSFATATCLNCRRKVPGTEIEDDVLQQRVPLCTVCARDSEPVAKKARKRGKRKSKGRWDSEESDEPDEPAFPPGIMKPDITFFGEKLTDDFEHALTEDRDKVDLLLVIGTSLKVAPVSDILSHLPHSVPQILINKTPVRHINPDIVLLGNADDIVHHLVHELGWDFPPAPAAHLATPRHNLKKRPSSDSLEPRRAGNSHIWLFEGAEGGQWVQEMEERAAKASTGTEDILEERGSEEPSTRELKKQRVDY